MSLRADLATSLAKFDASEQRGENGRWTGAGGAPSFRQRPLGEAGPAPSLRRSLIRSSLASRASKKLIPRSYTGSTSPERPVDSWKHLSIGMQVPKSLPVEQHLAVLGKLKQIVQGEREGATEKAKVTRQLVAVNGIKDYFTEKRRIGPLILDPETPKGAVNRAYNHAAMLALHDFGALDYDFKMSDAQKEELTPLVPFMRFVRRRLWNAMRSGPLKGARTAYLQAFGQPFPKPKFTPDGKERTRLRPNLELVKFAPAIPLAKGWGDPGDAERRLAALKSRRDPEGRETGLRAALQPFGATLDSTGVRLLTPAEIRAAARTVQIPSPAQAAAGNYRKGHLRIGGLPIAIETPAGRMRRGVGPTGRPWAVKMPAHYGYVKGTTGRDGDAIDVYLGPLAHEAQKHPVFGIDQVNARSKAFDEHKFCLGFPDRTAAIAAYDAAFSDGLGPKRRAAVVRMTFPEFRGWLAEGDTTQPLALPPQETRHA